MATYAIGDIQGCWEAFQQLLQDIAFDPWQDRLWLAGDLVNRGAGSLEVLRYAAGLGDRVQVVLGNHDIHLLAVARGLRKTRRSDTLDKLLKAPDAPALLDWLANQPLLHHDTALGFVMTHAGIPPIWTLTQAKTLAAEVEQELRSDRQQQLLTHLFGNKPRCWSDKLQGQERFRCIINYFTRMRFCKPDGTLELDSKSEAGSAPKGYAPWFSYPSQVLPESRMIFGHWAALSGHTGVGGIHALDTGCVWGQFLTAMRLEDQQVFRVASIKKDLI
ncbi:symmetrical bis(5'-nucleosyl)-tetraphosphatase [Marinospirillum alkaliphilum]|uniref:Bis(5'-nucleosyl)-tetraphosphatase, symmetrical n=1 Tax=Marinospirillum alkaliphilum DSM 21637 TaxID=1122209 RepID=A0A1K1VIG7_9GAMM|nr:symmetrical bis(5'-nucleosyl)-tetraphosphatase [Marinospirillum alkaliphilum]SFX24563.1 Bis(5'nucleosyl)-tetraphosphatase, ApaH [Marinospirillum alkaliphilum DSM 21637]